MFPVEGGDDSKECVWKGATSKDGRRVSDGSPLLLRLPLVGVVAATVACICIRSASTNAIDVLEESTSVTVEFSVESEGCPLLSAWSWLRLGKEVIAKEEIFLVVNRKPP